ncbi:MAG: uroporphyrinogen-III synthase, partial [Beijerinckiaceae bacterium]
MATILVTRPEADASRSAARLRELGHEVIVSPVLVVSPVEAPAPGSQIDATIVASANVAGYMGRDDVRGALSQKPVFAVGDRAAAGIRDLGYPDVRSAAGASADLAELAIRAVTPPARLLAPVGKAHRAEAFDILRARGFEVEPVVVYDAAPAEQLSTEAVAGLRYDVIDAVLHYSPRSAQIFVELAQRGDGGDRLARLHHVCLSDDVADALPEDLRSRATIAEAPNEDALIAALDAALSETSKGQGRLASGVAKPRRTPRQRAPRMIDATGARVAEESAEHAKRIAHSQREPSSPPEADIVAPIAPAVSLEKPNIELAAAGALKVPAEPVAARDVESAEEQAPQPAAHARPIDERAPSARPSLSESPPSPPPRKQGWSPLSLLFGGVAGAAAAL